MTLFLWIYEICFVHLWHQSWKFTLTFFFFFNVAIMLCQMGLWFWDFATIEWSSLLFSFNIVEITYEQANKSETFSVLLLKSSKGPLKSHWVTPTPSHTHAHTHPPHPILETIMEFPESCEGTVRKCQGEWAGCQRMTPLTDASAVMYRGSSPLAAKENKRWVFLSQRFSQMFDRRMVWMSLLLSVNVNSASSTFLVPPGARGSRVKFAWLANTTMWVQSDISEWLGSVWLSFLELKIVALLSGTEEVCQVVLCWGNSPCSHTGEQKPVWLTRNEWLCTACGDN